MIDDISFDEDPGDDPDADLDFVFRIRATARASTTATFLRSCSMAALFLAAGTALGLMLAPEASWMSTALLLVAIVVALASGLASAIVKDRAERAIKRARDEEAASRSVPP